MTDFSWRFKDFVCQIIKLDNSFIQSLSLAFIFIYYWILIFQGVKELLQLLKNVM